MAARMPRRSLAGISISSKRQLVKATPPESCSGSASFFSSSTAAAVRASSPASASRVKEAVAIRPSGAISGCC